MTAVNSAVVNVKQLVYAVMTDKDTETYGAVTALSPLINIKIAPASDMAKLYADGRQVENKSYIGDIGIDIETQDLPLEVQAELLGHALDTSTGVMTYNEADDAPYVAIGYEREKANGKSRFVWLYKTMFKEVDEEGKTKEDKMEFQTPKLSGTAIANKNGDWKKVADEDVKGSAITDFLATVPVSEPYDSVAPTVTTVPLDAATGVAVGASVVYTFSKAINPADVTDGNFFLLKSGANVACGLTLGTSNTVVTMKPSSNMSSGTYMAICTKDVRSAAGVKLAAAKITSFTV